ARDGALLHLDASGHLTVADVTYRARRGAESGEGTVRAPMAGTVARVLVQAGDNVRRGQTLAVLEAMKMEHNVTAAIDGTVEALNVAPGQQVAGRTVIATIRNEEPT
ncbi:MAG: acetyl-CoA carboxylase biotin carboxyl carrier protein subunit, partial [Rhizobiaceae bacterium]